MPAFMMAHPFLSFFLGIAAFGAIEAILKPPSPAAPPSPTPTTTGALRYDPGTWDPKRYGVRIDPSGQLTHTVSEFAPYVADGKGPYSMTGALGAPFMPSLPSFGMKAPRSIGVHAGLATPGNVWRARQAMNAMGI